MLIKTASYTGSYVDVKSGPKFKAPEFAFIGRSNVGKSTLINYLLNRKDLARTSSRPGKTQTINYYLVNESFYLVDLPGYGFAKVSKEKREAWEIMIQTYLRDGGQLSCVFQLIDSSIPVQDSDIHFSNWMGEQGIPFALVFTKGDKKEKTEITTEGEYEKRLLETWETLPPTFVSAAKKNKGKESLLDYIDKIMNGL